MGRNDIVRAIEIGALIVLLPLVGHLTPANATGSCFCGYAGDYYPISPTVANQVWAYNNFYGMSTSSIGYTLYVENNVAATDDAGNVNGILMQMFIVVNPGSEGIAGNYEVWDGSSMIATCVSDDSCPGFPALSDIAYVGQDILFNSAHTYEIYTWKVYETDGTEQTFTAEYHIGSGGSDDTQYLIVGSTTYDGTTIKFNQFGIEQEYSDQSGWNVEQISNGFYNLSGNPYFYSNTSGYALNEGGGTGGSCITYIADTCFHIGYNQIGWNANYNADFSSKPPGDVQFYHASGTLSSGTFLWGSPYVFVQAVDQNGNALTGYYVGLFNSGGTQIDYGYTPTQFSISMGNSYSIDALDYAYCNFDYWNDGTGSDYRSFTAATSTYMVFTAVYDCTSGSDPNITVNSFNQYGTQIYGYYTELDTLSYGYVDSGYTTYTYPSSDLSSGGSYYLWADGYGSCSFVQWSDGNTSMPREVTASGSQTFDADYTC